jgi:hypothetical protein
MSILFINVEYDEKMQNLWNERDQDFDVFIGIGVMQKSLVPSCI